MKQITTYVGIDAHKKDLFVAMLIGTQSNAVSWTVPNEPQAVRRLVKKLEREAPGPVHVFYEAGPVWVRLTTTGDDDARALRRRGAGADSAEAR